MNNNNNNNSDQSSSPPFWSIFTLLSVGLGCLFAGFILLAVYASDVESSDFNGTDQLATLFGIIFLVLCVGLFAIAFALALEYYVNEFVTEHIIRAEGQQQQQQRAAKKKHEPLKKCFECRRTWCNCFDATCGTSDCFSRCFYFCPSFQWFVGAAFLCMLLAIILLVTATAALNKNIGLTPTERVFVIFGSILFIVGCIITVCLCTQCEKKTWNTEGYDENNNIKLDEDGQRLMTKLNNRVLNELV